MHLQNRAPQNHNLPAARQQLQGVLTEMQTLQQAFESGKTSGMTSGMSQSDILARLSFDQQLKTYLAAQLGPSGVSNVSAAMAAKSSQSSAQNGKKIVNAVYQRGPFTLELEFYNGGPTMHRRINDLYFISNGVLTDGSDDVVGDAYGFIGREAR